MNLCIVKNTPTGCTVERKIDTSSSAHKNLLTHRRPQAFLEHRTELPRDIYFLLTISTIFGMQISHSIRNTTRVESP